MKIIFKIMIPVAILLVLSNIISRPPDVSYSNYNGTFVFEEMNFKSYDYELCKRRFEYYKQTHHQDTILYRLTPKVPWKFWLYKDYLFEEKFTLPYIDWKDVEVRRQMIKSDSLP